MNTHTYVDIFSGAGGIGEGFEQAGFIMLRSIDSDQHACKTLRTREIYRMFSEENEMMEYYKNYINGKINLNDLYKMHNGLKQHLKKIIKCKKLTHLNVYNEVNSIRKISNKEIDVLVGGPPCQAYSIIGRARDKNRKIYDEKHELYKIYLKIVSLLKPKFFVYENVPGLLSANNVNGQILVKLSKDFSNLRTKYTIIPKETNQTSLFPLKHLNFKDYIIDTVKFGVPQYRKRVILVGIRTDYYIRNKNLINEFWINFDKKSIDKEINVNDAINDLPHLYRTEGSDTSSGKYNMGRPTEYQKLMRKNSFGVSNHQARSHMASDVKRYKYFIEKSLDKNCHINLNDLKNEKPELMPNHRNQRTFLDRFKVQLPNRPSSTVTAHISKDGHYYIHPDIEQCRSLTVREAARLQSFPDNYYFEGPRTQQFRQVGNAVPPLLAKNIAETIKEILIEIDGR